MFQRAIKRQFKCNLISLFVLHIATSLIKLAFLYMIDKNLRNRRERVVDQTGSFEFVSFPAFFVQQKSYHDFSHAKKKIGRGLVITIRT